MIKLITKISSLSAITCVIGLTATLCAQRALSQGQKPAPQENSSMLEDINCTFTAWAMGGQPLFSKPEGVITQPAGRRYRRSPRSVSGRAPMTAQGPGGANSARFHGQ
jgi:hypothetical protein